MTQLMVGIDSRGQWKELEFVSGSKIDSGNDGGRIIENACDG